MMRPFSTLGWFALEMVGALELDRTTHPVMQAWALDALTPIDKADGTTNPGRTSAKQARLRVLAKHEAKETES